MMGCLVAIATFSTPCLGQAAEISPDKKSPAKLELSQMFSEEISNILNVCAENGGVNLAKANAQDGSVVCIDGQEKAQIPYKSYLSTFSDFTSALFLLGIKVSLINEPNAPEISQRLRELLTTTDGQEKFKGILKSALLNSNGAFRSGESLDILVAEVLTRTVPILKDSTALDQFLVGKDQDQQIVRQFCTKPGMSVSQAQAAITGVTSLQLYASCIKASGLTQDINNDASSKKSLNTPSSKSPPAPSSRR